MSEDNGMDWRELKRVSDGIVPPAKDLEKMRIECQRKFDIRKSAKRKKKSNSTVYNNCYVCIWAKSIYWTDRDCRVCSNFNFKYTITKK